ncbi:MAG: MTH1187 family thiamine-binding protein [Deltaproteobacteria bacterium]|nr:MTH1187 family thiamine-binding protein [Deltaproteobacteria bacterium]
MAIAEVSIVPIGTATTSVSDFVAEAVSIVKTSGLRFELTAMGTMVEGDLAAVLETIQKMHESPFSKGVKRVYTVIKIDDRRDKQTGMDYKVHSVQGKL